MPRSSFRQECLKTLKLEMYSSFLGDFSSSDDNSTASSIADGDSDRDESSDCMSISSTSEDELLESYVLLDEIRYLEERLICKDRCKAWVQEKFENLGELDFRQMTRMNKSTFWELLATIKNHSIFQNNSTCAQAPVSLQLVAALDRFGHYGNGVCLRRTLQLWGIGSGTLVLYTSRCIEAIIDILSEEIKWPNVEERNRISEVFSMKGFHGCIGLIDGTTFPLSQRPRDGGECYFDRKSRYSINAQVVCDDRRRIISFSTGMPGSCSDWTCFGRSKLADMLRANENVSERQYILGDSGYNPHPHLVCSYRMGTTGNSIENADRADFNHCVAKTRYVNEHCIGVLKARWHSLKEIQTQLKEKSDSQRMVRWLGCCVILHNFVIRHNDNWTEDDSAIVLDSDSRPTQNLENDNNSNSNGTVGDAETMQRAVQLRLNVRSSCLEFNRMVGGILAD